MPSFGADTILGEIGTNLAEQLTPQRGHGEIAIGPHGK